LAAIPESAREVIESGKLGHLVTTNKDGSPQVSGVWVGIEDGEIVAAHTGVAQKVRNIRRDRRVALSIEGTRLHGEALEYLVVYGRARVTEGGATELLRRLAVQYLGREVDYGEMSGDGFITRITPERFSGTGPWAGNV
jgi:PPOX class probable F420-dependent enzyme